MRATERPYNVQRATCNGASAVQRTTLHVARCTLHGLRNLVSSVKAVVGMPDYERYLEHRRTCHPGEPVLSRREHYLEYLKWRYSGGGGRCC
jgi:uncharacterized short protein YbdD (DUF466 family)